MASKRRTRFYDTITDQAKIEEAGSLVKERAVLLLWFLRTWMGLRQVGSDRHIY